MSGAVARVQSSAPVSAAPVGVLRRKCDCGGSGHECEQCKKKKNPLQRQAAGGSGPGRAPEIVHEVLRSPGQSLDRSTRAFMEARFGHDFSRVRVHADARAAESARLVRAKAYTVGHDVVMGAGQPSPATVEGRRLLAHELTHTIQQTESGRTAGVPDSLKVGPEDDTHEREADAVAASVVGGRSGGSARVTGHQPAAIRRVSASAAPVLQRRVKVTPAAAVGDVHSQFERLCPGQLVASGDEIRPGPAGCQVSSTQSCECACDTAFDPKRTYTVDVQPAASSKSTKTLHNKKTAVVPDSSVWPHTASGNDPAITMAASSGSNIEFGFFDSAGRPFWYDNWRILAHELCGHGRLNQTYTGPTGCRPGHDVTIDTENAIAAEHGGPARGHSGDPRRGEAFFNPVGDRKKVVFHQCNGLHYEAP
ncbi:MAG: DUF4157 domain-containing protein [Gemmatimonadales bacterium]